MEVFTSWKIDSMKLILWTIVNICWTIAFNDICRTFNFTYQLKTKNKDIFAWFIKRLVIGKALWIIRFFFFYLLPNNLSCRWKRWSRSDTCVSLLRNVATRDDSNIAEKWKSHRKWRTWNPEKIILLQTEFVSKSGIYQKT